MLSLQVATGGVRLSSRQRRMRSSGSRTVYVDSAPVRCALRGRVLVWPPREGVLWVLRRFESHTQGATDKNRKNQWLVDTCCLRSLNSGVECWDLWICNLEKGEGPRQCVNPHVQRIAGECHCFLMTDWRDRDSKVKIVSRRCYADNIDPGWPR